MYESLKRGTLLSARYRILARIGEGGFGTVYKARDQRKYGKLVAIKEINMATLSAQEKIEVTDSYNREITLLSNLKHKNLPRIYDHFTDPEHWYIVMDYIEGQTLEDLLARSPKGRLSIEQTTTITHALCDVLSYLHNQHPAIIFRDVKPGNIMLTFWGHLYLIDFGIARRYRVGQARDTGSLGSPGYAAPEQYGRMQTTTQTDIYGLGATIQTLLTGKEPLEVRLQGIPPEVHLPWKLQRLIKQMTDPDPFKRPRDVNKVKQSLPNVPIPWRFPWSLCVSGYIIQYGSTGLNQSGFSDSPFASLYFLFILAFIVSYCIPGLIEPWRIAPAGLSVKATIIIIGQRFLSSLIPVGVLSVFISLLYAILAPHPISEHHMITLWLNTALSVIAILAFLLIKRYRWSLQLSPNPQSWATHQQARPQQQVQKRP